MNASYSICWNNATGIFRRGRNIGNNLRWAIQALVVMAQSVWTVGIRCVRKQTTIMLLVLDEVQTQPPINAKDLQHPSAKLIHHPSHTNTHKIIIRVNTLHHHALHSRPPIHISLDATHRRNLTSRIITVRVNTLHLHALHIHPPTHISHDAIHRHNLNRH